MEIGVNDILTWIIAFIGIGVTVLIGINIWVSLNIDRRINKKLNKAQTSK